MEGYTLLELGSNSLKGYRVQPAHESPVTTYKVPWKVAHDFFSGRATPESSTQGVLDALECLRCSGHGFVVDGALNVVTGVFRELPWITELAERVRDASGLCLRLISGVEEAKLMSRCFSPPLEGGAFLCDVGGASTEWAWFLDGKPRAAGSLRLGAIRNHGEVPPRPEAPEAYLRAQSELVMRALEELPLVSKSRLFAIGGTARTLAEVAQSRTVGLQEVRNLMGQLASGRVLHDVPACRAEVFIPGLAILLSFATWCQAERIEHGVTSVQEGMASRLVRLAKRADMGTIRETLLLRTRML